MRLPRLAAAPIVCVLAACADAPSEPAAPRTLHARWVAPEFALQPQGTLRQSLTLTPDGQFRLDIDSYGVYPTDSPNTRSAWTRTVGTYTVRGDSLVFRPSTLVTWDSFYKTPLPTVLSPYPYGGVFDGCRFEVRGDALVLHFLTYPLDAPVPTTATFRRQPTGFSG